MIRFITNFSHRLPQSWKFIFVGLLLIALFCGGLYWFSGELFDTLGVIVKLDSNTSAHIQTLIVSTTSLSIIGISLLMLLLFADSRSQINKLNRTVKDALKERKLDKNFDSFYSGKTFDDVSDNIQGLFTLFKSFDNMKTNRVATEVSTISVVINQMQHGVLMINKDKVVTAVNHTAEQLLKLIPGEIIGQTISRKISNIEILEHLDLALNKDQKTKDKLINENEEGKELTISIYPIHNKIGDVVRAVIIVHQPIH